MLDLLELNLGSRTNLDDCHAAGQLCQALLKLLAVKVRGGVFNLTLDLVDTVIDGFFGAIAVNDGGVVLGDLDRLGTTEHLCGNLGEVVAKLLHDGLATGKDCNILKHTLTAIAIAGCLNGAHVKNAAELVQDKRGQSLAVNIFSNDKQWRTLLLNGLKHGKNVLNVGNLLIGHQDVGIFKLSRQCLIVGSKIRRDIALVKLHTLNGININTKGLRLLNGNDTVFADNVHSVGNLSTDRRITGRNGTNGSNLLLGGNVLSALLHLVNNGINGLIDTTTDGNRVSACRNVTKTLVDNNLCKQSCGGCTVADGIVGLCCNFLHQLSAHVLHGIRKLNFLGDGNTIVGNSRSAV